MKDPATYHQQQIALDTIRNPMKALFLGAPTLAEAYQIRLEYLRKQLRAERISYAGLAELADYAEHIHPEDTELREAAGLPEA